MANTPYPQSYYAASANPVPERPALQGEVETDVCVIGAGYTGLSSALFLLENGFRVTVLEAAKVGFGASGRNGGQIVNSYSRDIDVIERTVGPRQAQLLGQMAFEGAAIIRDRVSRYGIQCDLKDGGVFAALTSKQLAHLEAQQRLWERYGHSHLELMDKRRINEVVACDQYIGGLLDMTGGHIHPLNLALGEAAAVETLGGTIYEQSAAIRIERGANPVVHTAQGRVRARFIIVAGNAYLGNLVPELAAKSMPCGTQVITTEPLSDELAKTLLPQDYCVEDCNYLLDYYRLSADKRLIFGGGVVYGARDPANIEAIIRPKMLKAFPQLKDVKIDYAWTGNFLLTLSRLPQVGRLGDNIYYSQGCSGHGVTYTHLAGKVLAEALRGQAERFDAFADLPHYPFPGGQMLRTPLTALGAWYYSLRDRLGF
ncbi:FAD-binding oxidoreductase [Pseudomonas syringae pv. actinidiae]|uniref:FAD-binding oxidoreductase n=3 Tax=Pseudomonas syringae TaxID=317 RepID=A0A0K8M657_PSESF|nr:FAD-binding oxidoreductase [Pseudomonas syringae]EPN63882.1 gamma-glutamylputrescine oxidoreductase [Pseudomonas syringae pv. actinidiae ICMP 19079]EPN72002.1 gamma-glutamylputrescine oxidoreductase [Pseudomonas syringae pv. actinidiae ICMP 19101]AKT30704.1 gamma-glutamylputrescine oxidoreductase [Pseudomonas syringae pv. actinidiae ICMP 18884]AOE57124.1 gamma-glutamylputrescine oxidoreductase [Pseudomonas syringae pv. actinidiae ICMP 18708]APP98082.1 gamma-glutamylputrescine oxidoreductase